LRNSWPRSRLFGTQLSNPLSSSRLQAHRRNVALATGVGSATDQTPVRASNALRRPAGSLLAFLLTLALSGVVSTEAGQAPGRQDQQATKNRVLTVAREIIVTARFASFVTVGDHGAPQARIVDPLAPDDDFVVYVATNPLSRKVREIRKDSRVTLLYFDAGRPGYVTLAGRAQEVSGAEKRTHHKSDWQAFFPAERPESYVLYRVVPARVEVVSAKDGLPGDPTTWRPEIVLLK
jgi:general stress protein 26